jgi:hypothetical protein
VIEAGVEAYRPYWPDLADGFDVSEKMVRDVWEAMVAAARRARENQIPEREQ